MKKLLLISALLIAVISISSCSKDEGEKIEPYVYISPEDLNIPKEGGTFEVLVESNVRLNYSWVSGEFRQPDWFSMSHTDKGLRFIVKPNPESGARGANLQIYTDNVNGTMRSRMLVIHQDPRGM